MATGLATVLPMATCAPSHLPMATGAFPFSNALPNTVPSSVVLPVVMSAPSSTIISLPVSNSNHSSGGQVVVNETGVNFNIAASSPVQAMSTSQGTSSSHAHDKEITKPFILMIKICVCQSCRKNYDGINDTLGLVVARAEQRLVSNLSTGVQFLERASNSHYHAHKGCLMRALMARHMYKSNVRVKLDAYQKLYLSTCLEVPFEALNV